MNYSWLYPTFIGFVVGWWGWHNIRNNRHLFWATVAFLCGLAVCVYGFMRLIEA